MRLGLRQCRFHSVSLWAYACVCGNAILCIYVIVRDLPICNGFKDGCMCERNCGDLVCA